MICVWFYRSIKIHGLSCTNDNNGEPKKRKSQKNIARRAFSRLHNNRRLSVNNGEYGRRLHSRKNVNSNTHIYANAVDSVQGV